MSVRSLTLSLYLYTDTKFLHISKHTTETSEVVSLHLHVHTRGVLEEQTDEEAIASVLSGIVVASYSGG